MLESATAQPPRLLKAGAATSNITPPLDLNSPIAGAWSSPPGDYIHDELRVRCLVLDDGQTRIAMAVADNIGIPEYVLNEAKRRTEARTGIAADRILVSATHTHSGASARGRDSYSLQGELDGYQNFVADRIADAVQGAVHNLEPARVGWGKADLPEEVFNRRWLMKPGTPLPNPFEGVDRVRMNPGVGNPDILEPSGPTDPEICFLSLQSAEGRPFALFANYSLHYVGGVPRGHISADYFAVFCEKIAELSGCARPGSAVRRHDVEWRQRKHQQHQLSGRAAQNAALRPNASGGSQGGCGGVPCVPGRRVPGLGSRTHVYEEATRCHPSALTRIACPR